MTEIAQLLTAIVALLTALGGGCTWLWRRVEKRFAKIEKELRECQQRERDSAKRETDLVMSLRETAGKHITVIELLWQEVARLSRGAPNAVLERALKLLDDLKKEADHD